MIAVNRLSHLEGTSRRRIVARGVVSITVGGPGNRRGQGIMGADHEGDI